MIHPGNKKYSGYIQMKMVIQEHLLWPLDDSFTSLYEKHCPRRSISPAHTLLLDLGF